MYIANQMVARAPGSKAPGSTPKSPMDDYYDDSYDISDSTDAPMVETRITYNGGGRWQRMPAPTSFNNAKCNRWVETMHRH